MIKSGGQYICVSQGPNAPCLEVGQDTVTLGARCLTRYAFGGDALGLQCGGNVLGVSHTGAKHQPGLALKPQAHYFSGHHAVLVAGVYRCLQLAFDILSATLVNPVHFQFGGGQLTAKG